MSPEMVGVLGVVLLIVLFMLRVQIGIALLLVGLAGYTYLTRVNVGLAQLGMSSYGTTASYNMSVMPLFILMGMLLSFSGLGRDLYRAMNSWLGRIRGGLAIATVGACAIFAAISGSNNATTATMATVALPEMRRYNYNPKMATAVIAAGGTLGVLIPPSVILVLYGGLTNEPIGKLLIAGLIPGLLQMLLFMATIYLQVRIDPTLAPLSADTERIGKLESLIKIWPVLLVFSISIGGIYFGFFTPTEGGGVGAAGAFLLALISKRLSFKALKDALDETLRVNAMIFLILIGATIFGQFFAVTKIPMEAASFIGGLHISRYLIVAGILVVYLILGCFMEGIAIMVLTVPIIYPIITHLGFSGIWFGVVLTMMLNIGALTPPVGISVYVMSSFAKDVPMQDIFRGVMPLLASMIFCVILVTIFPQIITFLPSLMK